MNMLLYSGKKVIVKDWIEDYIDKYSKPDVRHLIVVRKKFIEFTNNSSLTFDKIDAVFIKVFIEYLQAESVGGSAASFFARFKKMMKYAHRKKMIKYNVTENFPEKVNTRMYLRFLGKPRSCIN